MDSDDQLRIIKRISKELDLDEASWPARQSQWQINNWKDDGLRSKNIDDKGVCLKIFLKKDQLWLITNLLRRTIRTFDPELRKEIYDFNNCIKEKIDTYMI